MTTTNDAPPRAGISANDGRSALVDTVLNDFTQRSGLDVPDDVRDFIFNEVLVPDEEWDAAVRERRLEADQTRSILAESLLSIAQTNQEFAIETNTVSADQARESFYAVIHNRWKCPFPFIFC